jgi:hypothetical protein
MGCNPSLVDNVPAARLPAAGIVFTSSAWSCGVCELITLENRGINGPAVLPGLVLHQPLAGVWLTRNIAGTGNYRQRDSFQIECRPGILSGHPLIF